MGGEGGEGTGWLCAMSLENLCLRMYIHGGKRYNGRCKDRDVGILWAM